MTQRWVLGFIGLKLHNLIHFFLYDLLRVEYAFPLLAILLSHTSAENVCSQSFFLLQLSSRLRFPVMPKIFPVIITHLWVIAKNKKRRARMPPVSTKDQTIAET